MSRAELLELLLEESRENERLRAQLQEMNEKLADRAIRIERAGSIAEAALQLNGVFQAAEEAAAEEPAQEEPLAAEEEEEDLVKGDVNPYTGREYKSNSVRMHPKRIGYVQVYDRGEHKWTDMTEWAFLGYQERKKALLGKDYEPPIYLD